MNTVRKIVFYLFVLLYLVLCPYLILYALGYIYNPVQKEIAQTGLIYLSSTPAQADIYLEKSRFRQKTPAQVSGLTPGNYRMTLRLKGHKPWSQVVTVAAGKAVAFGNILLIPEKWRASRHLAESFSALTPLPDTKRMLLAKTQRLGDYFIFNTRKGESLPLLAPDSPFKDFTVRRLFTNREGAAFFVQGGALWKPEYLNIDFANGEESNVTDVTPLILDVPMAVEWTTQPPETIFVFYGKQLDRLEIGPASLFPKYIEPIKGFGLRDKWIYILDQENTVRRLTYDKGKEEILFRDEFLAGQLFSPADTYAIKFINADTLVFHSRRGQLLTNRPPYRIAEKDIRGVEFDEKHKLLVFWTGQSISWADFHPSAEEKSIFSEAVKITSLYENGRDITDVFLTADGTHLVFKDGNRLFLAEIEPQGEHHIEFITDIKKDSGIFYDSDSGEVYYINSENGELCSIEVMSPQRQTLDELVSREDIGS